MPVYEGEKGFETEAGQVTLGSNSMNVIHVETDEVREGELVRTLRVAGMINADDTQYRILSAYIDGRIEKLAVNHIGAEVKQGTLLATLYSPALLAAEREYLALLEQKEMTTAPGLQLERARLVEGATQRLKRLGVSDEQIAKLKNKSTTNSFTEILAPRSGTVVARHVYEGQYVKEGDKLFEIADFSKMWLQFDAYERDLTWIQVGQEIEVTTPAVPNKVYKAKVSFIDPNVVEMTRSARVRVEIQNPLIEEMGRSRRELLNKLYAEGKLKIETPRALIIPRTAVLQAGSKPVAYVDQGGGTYEQRELKLGREGDQFYEVLAGLKAGEKVVTTGNMLIDAQAQLNQTSKGSSPPPGKMPEPSIPVALDESQAKALTSFIAFADRLGGALADDNLTAFNQSVEQDRGVFSSLKSAFPKEHPWNISLQAIEQHANLSKAKDLKEARTKFLPFSMGSVELVKRVRQQQAFASVKIFRCPMVDQAIPGAAKNGFWIQTKPPLRNPFFGSDMLECGNEVTP